jgi:hypothetical protein
MNKTLSTTLIGVTAFALMFWSASGAVAKPKPKPKKTTIAVTVIESGGFFDTAEEATQACASGAGVGLRVGSQVKVTDGNGAIVGIGRLARPSVFEEQPTFFRCNYRARIKVPISDFYTFEVNGRPGPDITASELKRDKNRLTLTYR